MAAILQSHRQTVQRSLQPEVAIRLSLEICVLKARLLGAFLLAGNVFLHPALLICPPKG